MRKTVSNIVVVCSLLLMHANTANAEHYLSRDICRVEFESLKKHEKHVARVLSGIERYQALEQLSVATNKSCLKAKIVSWNRYKANQQNASRQKPYIDKCDGLPKLFYADAAGRTIYIVSNRQMQRLDANAIENESLDKCLSPLMSN